MRNNEQNAGEPQVVPNIYPTAGYTCQTVTQVTQGECVGKNSSKTKGELCTTAEQLQEFLSQTLTVDTPFILQKPKNAYSAYIHIAYGIKNQSGVS